MKRTFKKLISLLLAVVLVAGMLPAGTVALAAGEAATESITFVGKGSNGDVYKVTEYELWNNTNWIYFGGADADAWNTKMIRKNNYEPSKDPNTLRLKAASADGAWIAFEIDFKNDALTAGVYSLSTTTVHLTGATNGTPGAKFWFAEATSDNAADYKVEKNLIKEADASDSFLTATGTYTLSENITIKNPAAKHVLVVELTSDIRLGISNFTFARIGDLPTGGDSTGDDSTGGDSTGGDSTGGDSTGGDSTGGDSTGGVEAEETFSFNNVTNGNRLYDGSCNTNNADVNPNWTYLDRALSYKMELDDLFARFGGLFYKSTKYSGYGFMKLADWDAVMGLETWTALKLTPENSLPTGKYKLTFNFIKDIAKNRNTNGNKQIAVYLAEYVDGKEDGAYYKTEANLIKPLGTVTTTNEATDSYVADIGSFYITNPDAEYVLIVEVDGAEMWLHDFTLTKVGDIPTASAEVTLSKDTVRRGETAEAGLAIGGNKVISSDITFSKTGDAVEIDSKTGVITPVNPGTATITATYGTITATKEITVSADEPVAGTANIFVYSIVDGTVGKTGISTSPAIAIGSLASVTKGTAVSLTASGIDGKRFLQWQTASGNLISDEETYTFTANSDTEIVCVYEDIPEPPKPEEVISFVGMGINVNVEGVTQYGASSQKNNWKYFGGSETWKNIIVTQPIASVPNCLRLKPDLSDDGETYKAWVALKISFQNKEILTPGKFTLSMELAKATAPKNGTAGAKFWFAKADSKTSAEGYMTDANLIKEASSSDPILKTSGTYVLAENIGVSNLDKEYVLVIELESDIMLNIKNFTLARTGDLEKEETFTFANVENGSVLHERYSEGFNSETNPNWKFFDKSDDYKKETLTADQAKLAGLGYKDADHNNGEGFLKMADCDEVSDAWTALLLDPAETLQRGMYKLSFDLIHTDNNGSGKKTPGEVAVWIAEYDPAKNAGADYKTDENKIIPLTTVTSVVKDSNYTQTTFTSEKEFAVMDDEAAYVLIVEVDGVEIWLTDFTIKKNRDIPDPVEGYIEGHEDGVLSTGSQAAVKYVLYNPNGTEYVDTPESSEDDVTVFFESENALVAEIDQNGIITAKNAGTTNIIIYAQLGKTAKKGLVSVTVTDETSIASVKISGPNSVEKNFKIKLSASAVNDSGSTTLIESAKFDYADDESKQFIEVSADGTIRGLSVGEGRVVVTVKSTTGFEKTSEPYVITVDESKPGDKIIDFRRGTLATGGTTANFATDGFTVNETYTSEYLLNDNKKTKPSNFRWLKEGLFVNPKENGATREADVAFNIKIDHSGWYMPTFTAALHPSGADRMDLYLNGEYIGWYSLYGTTWLIPSGGKPMNPVYLEAGEDNVFVLRSVDITTSGDNYSYLHNLHLKYLDEAPVITETKLTAEKTILAVGETSRVDTIAALSNGSEYEFGFMHGYTGDTSYPDNKRNEKAYVEYTSSDENVAKVEDGQIITVGPGECIITSTAYFNGDSEGVKSKELTVTVTEETLDKIVVTPEKLDLLQGQSQKVTVDAYLTGGARIAERDLTITYKSNNESVVNNDKYAYRIDAKGTGSTTFTVTVEFNGTTLSYDIPVDVVGEGFATVNLSSFTQLMRPGTAGYDISVECLDASGAAMDSSGANVTFESSDESVVKVSAGGHMTPGEVGTAEITATVELDGVVRVGKMNVSVRTGKVERTYYTEEKVANARDNIKKYEWAKSTSKAAVKTADKYLEYVDHLYELMPSEGIPRSYANGFVNDPEAFLCRYCGADLMARDDRYPWGIDALKNPWKIKCPQCARVFPSNDFGSFYELGKNEKGEFNLQYALEKHREKFLDVIEETYPGVTEPGKEYTDSWYKYYGYGIKGGYLTNDLYPEVGSERATSFKGKFSEHERPEWWGVDNGFGYFTGRTYDNGVKEVHTYIAVFIHSGLWATTGAGNGFQPAIFRALESFRDAYIYTGDKKYGRAGAKLLDRLADFWPDYELYQYRGKYQNSNQHGKSGGGKIIGNIWESSFMGPLYSTTYDAFFDIYEDEELLDYLTKKAIKYNQTDKLVDGKVTPEKLRSNVEKGILERLLDCVIESDIGGNFGFAQNTLTKAAIVLDDSELTPKYLQFVMQPGDEPKGYGDGSYTPSTGGNVLNQIMTIVDRDGFGDESSLGYLQSWATRLLDVAEDLRWYAKIRPQLVKKEYNLFENPKYIKMFTIVGPTVVSGAQAANIGDSSDVARRTPETVATLNLDHSKAGYEATGSPLFAQMLYNAVGGEIKDLYTSIFDNDPEAIQKKLKADIEKYGEYDFSKSQLLSGYGFSSLISGDAYSSDLANTDANTLRTFWMYFGGGHGHRHWDRMNLGIDFYGYDFAPEFGYPATVGGQDKERNERWTQATLSHNTVLVNETRQSNVTRTAEADILHFDDSGDIQIMDVDAPLTYLDTTDIYRRTVVSVDIDDTATYALDFFRVKGGDEHVYSFHSQSVDITFSDNLKFVKQPFGTYAGANIAFADNVAYTPLSGYNYLYNVRRAKNPGTGEFTADFKVEYLRLGKTGPDDLGLKFTMLNNFDITEVASAFGNPPRYTNNPLEFEYLLVKREGKDLDTLFTSVIEPYKGSSKIAEAKRVDAIRVDGKPIPESEPCEAIKVTLTNGRVDYIVYAANKDREYIISDNGEEVFRFRGFVGVYTVSEAGEASRVYLHDGVKLDDGQEYAITEGSVFGSVTGKVKDFTKTNEFESFIDIQTTADVPAETLVGKIINVDTDDTQNGVYRIVGAEKTSDGYRINTGAVTLIRAMQQSANGDITYIYNITDGAKCSIPLTEYTTTAPEISTVDGSNEYSVSVGSLITIPITASSIIGLPLTFDASGLPRGAYFDEEEMAIVWKPSKTQVGENVASIIVSDGTFNQRLTVIINVFGSTTGGSSGGGGGGDVPSDTPADEPTVDPEDPTDEPTDEPGTDTPSETKGFTDLGEHAWAEESINALADAGIIKGTSSSTYSPKNNITRADYAILLVRAFELESENAENFADVSDADYFAAELAVARNTGIVGGIGDNKYAPRNTITRQDMMVILYRAMTKQGVELKPIEGIDVSTYADYEDVADYARDAVKELVEAGLVNGKGEGLAGGEFTTRAEVAVLLKRVLDYIAK